MIQLLCCLPQHCQLGLQTGSSRCAALPLAGRPVPPPLSLTVSGFLAAADAAKDCGWGGGRVHPWDGVFWAVTPPLEKHKITSDLPASSWRKITRSIWPEADVKKMAAPGDPAESKGSVLGCPAGPASITVSKPGKM